MIKRFAPDHALRRAGDALLTVLVASVCPACEQPLDRPLDGPVCADCWAGVRPPSPPLCVTCGAPLPSWRVIDLASVRCAACRRRPQLVDAGSSAGEYEGPLRAIIHAFKYEGRRSLARPLAARMAHAGARLMQDVSCAVPVPLHPWRLVRRGFNQASDLAVQLDIPVVRALVRTRATAPQTGLTAGARRRNVGLAFSAAPLLGRRLRARRLEDQVVLLVDDVRTTGATLNACARVLKACGAREVRALTAARAAIRSAA